MDGTHFRQGGHSGHNIWMEGPDEPEGGTHIGCMFDPDDANVVVHALNTVAEAMVTFPIASSTLTPAQQAAVELVLAAIDWATQNDIDADVEGTREAVTLIKRALQRQGDIVFSLGNIGYQPDEE